MAKDTFKLIVIEDDKLILNELVEGLEQDCNHEVKSFRDIATFETSKGTKEFKKFCIKDKEPE